MIDEYGMFFLKDSLHSRTGGIKPYDKEKVNGRESKLSVKNVTNFVKIK